MIITKHHQKIFVAVNGEVSTTTLADDLPIWRVKTAAHAVVWSLQSPDKPFQSLTTAMTHHRELSRRSWA